jgi:hypothetical protein
MIKKGGILSSSATRAQRYRQRRRDGDVVVQVEVSAPAIAGLANYGLIDADNVTRDKISFALEVLLDAIERKAIEFDEDWIDSFGDG